MVRVPPPTSCLLRLIGALLIASLHAPAQAAPELLERFFGMYEGMSDSIPAGETSKRDLRVIIRPVKNGFSVDWETGLHTSSSRTEQKKSAVAFTSTRRMNIYASAMRVDLFGNAVPLDPFDGEPLIWATVAGETLGVYIIYITDSGAQDLQIYKRTLTPEGLNFEFTRFFDAEPVRRITGTLKKVSEVKPLPTLPPRFRFQPEA